MKLRAYRVVAFLGALFSLSSNQAVSGQILNQDTEIRVHGLPKLVAPSSDPVDILLTSLATIFHDKEVCCGKGAALEDSARKADPNSLKDIADRLNGRHLLSDGRPILVTAEYVPPDSMNSGKLIKAIMDQHAGLMQWNSNLYVLDGLVYVWLVSGDNSTASATTAIHKFLLRDTRYSDARGRVRFNRDKDDLSKIGGLLFVHAKHM